MTAIRYSLLILGLFYVTACGGGGGGPRSSLDGTGPAADGARPAAPSVLDFLEPDSFVNGRVHETTRASLSLVGGLQSAYTPTLDCDQSANHSPRSTGFTLRWRNDATGASGETGVSVFCRDSQTIFGVGVHTRWRIDNVSLALGSNRIQLHTYRGSELVGEDTVTLRRVDGVPPTVEFRYPGEDATGVPTDHPVLVRFSEPMVPSSLTAERFVVTDEAGRRVNGHVSYHAEHVFWSFAPADPLTPATAYRVTVTRGVQDVGGGGTLQEDVTWRFSTGAGPDEAAPIVDGVWPGEHCDCAAPSVRVMIGFSEPLQPSTLIDNALSLLDESGVSVSGRTVYYGSHLTFQPDTPLQAGRRYQARLSDAVTDLSGRGVAGGVAWQFTISGQPPFGRWEESTPPPEPLRGARGAWTGSNYLVWGEGDLVEPGSCEAWAESCADTVVPVGKGLRYDPAIDQWQAMAFQIEQYDGTTEPFPPPRRRPGITWVDGQLIVFGGENDRGPVSDGGVYDPLADAWSRVRDSWWDPVRGSYPYFRGLTRHTAIWTGSRLIVWGGRYGSSSSAQPTNRGWAYDPAYDTWHVLGDGPTVNERYEITVDPAAPSPRYGHTAVWTGQEMIVWGGFDAEGRPLTDGGRYHPDTDTWRPLSPVAAPTAASGRVTAVWTGMEMIVWNGWDPAGQDGFLQPNLKRYDPAADRWTTSQSGWEPRFEGTDEASYFAFWTGTVMLAVGRDAMERQPDPDGIWQFRRTLTAYAYDPAADRWHTGASLRVDEAAAPHASLADGRVLLFDGQLHAFVPGFP